MSATVPAVIEGEATVTAEVPKQTIEVTPEKKVPSLPPTTTIQQDLTTAGQRRVNLIWEGTQSAIAVLVVLTSMAVFVINSFGSDEKEFPSTLSNMAFMVLAFYLARTNHQAIGGVGKKPSQPYEGR